MWIVLVLGVGISGLAPRLNKSKINAYGPEMVEIEGGTYIMGQNDGEGESESEVT